MEIRTNNIPRLLKYGYEMPEKFKAEFDYIEKEEFDYHDFFTYKCQWYNLDDFMLVSDVPEFKGWYAYRPDYWFSGILVKFVDDVSIVVGQYFN